jgi:hypothetical protein
MSSVIEFNLVNDRIVDPLAANRKNFSDKARFKRANLIGAFKHFKGFMIGDVSQFVSIIHRLESFDLPLIFLHLGVFSWFFGSHGQVPFASTDTAETKSGFLPHLLFATKDLCSKQRDNCPFYENPVTSLLFQCQ